MFSRIGRVPPERQSIFYGLTIAGLVRVHGPTRIGDALKQPVLQAHKAYTGAYVWRDLWNQVHRDRASSITRTPCRFLGPCFLRVISCVYAVAPRAPICSFRTPSAFAVLSPELGRHCVGWLKSRAASTAVGICARELEHRARPHAIIYGCEEHTTVFITVILHHHS